MAEKDGLNGYCFSVNGGEVPESFRVEPIIENTDEQGGGLTVPAPAPALASASAPGTQSVAAASPAAGKKKRGRPRKYGSDGSILALSPMPISASIHLTGEYSSWKGPFKKKNKLEFGNPGGMHYTGGGTGGGGLMPHMLTVDPGEDIMKKILSFCQQGYQAICILAANGSISNVTLRHPNSSGGTLTYEGCFELISLTGSFLLKDDGATKSRSGGMSVLLAGPDGRVMGGGLSGVLVAASLVQIVVGSFIPGNQDQKPKKPDYKRTISFGAPNNTGFASEDRFDLVFGATEPSVPFNVDNSATINLEHGFKNTTLPESNASLPARAPGEQSHEITC